MNYPLHYSEEFYVHTSQMVWHASTHFQLDVKNEYQVHSCNNLKFSKYTGSSKVSVHLMITIQKVITNVQSVPRQSPDIY
jgi:nitrate reductase cytochrome c-type subunit